MSPGKSPPRVVDVPLGLGGTITDFQQRYGPATDRSGLMFAATIARQRALTTRAFDDPSEGQDGQQHVTIIAVPLRHAV